jgi:hypothetical protein
MKECHVLALLCTSAKVVRQHVVGVRCADTLFGGFASSRGSCNKIGDIGSGGSGAVWGKREHGDSLGAAVAFGGSRPSPPDERRSPLAVDRAPRRGIGAGGAAAGPDLAGDPRHAGGGARDRCRTDEFVAISQGAEDYAHKKSLHAGEQDRPELAEARRAFIRRQPSLDPDRLVFIDETWAATNMARRYDRTARGLRHRRHQWRALSRLRRADAGANPNGRTTSSCSTI